MCIAPLTLDDGLEVACHECWQCREQAVNDWVGRNIAESLTATASHAVTLTYGRSQVGDVDHERAALLTYSDVQKYLKLLRRHGFPVRYFAIGEYGSRKGRAHWHLMLYWQDKVPPHELDVTFMEAHWPHGWSFWTAPTHHAVRYNCKYIAKDMGDAERQGHLAMSKKPPLGAAYFAALAEKHVREGIAPQDLFYSFPEVERVNRGGVRERVQFMLRDRSAELFLEHFVRMWRELRPGEHVPNGELVEEFMDTGAWTDDGSDYRQIDLRARERMPDQPKPRPSQTYRWMNGKVVWNKDLQCWQAPARPGSSSQIWFWVQNAKGAYQWRASRKAK